MLIDVLVLIISRASSRRLERDQRRVFKALPGEAEVWTSVSAPMPRVSVRCQGTYAAKTDIGE